MSLVVLILGLVVSAIGLIVMQGARVRFGIIWVTSLMSALAAWVAMLALAWRLPVSIAWPLWRDLSGGFGGADWFILDTISWPIGFALLTIGLAAVSGSLVRQPTISPTNLAGILALCAVGLAAVTAGAITPLLFAWTALDLYELILQLTRTNDREASEKIVVSVSGSVLGTFLIAFAIGVSRSGNFDLVSLPVSATLAIILGAGFRLGVLPVQPPVVPELGQRRGLHTMLRLAPVAGTLSVLARAARFGVPGAWELPLFVIALTTGLYGAVNWLRSSDEKTGLPFWILGTASVAICAVLFREPAAVIGVGVSTLMGGSLLFLREVFSPRGILLNAIVGILMAGVVFTPSAPIATMIAGLPPIAAAAVILLMVILLSGYMKHARTAAEPDGEAVAGINSLHVGGLSLIVAAMVFAGLVPLAWGAPLANDWWPGLLVIATVVAFVLFGGRYSELVRRPSEMVMRALRVFSPYLFYRLLWRTYRLTGRGVNVLSRMLEGRSAVLWAILLLAFLVALFNQLGVGS